MSFQMSQAAAQSQQDIIDTLTKKVEVYEKSLTKISKLDYSRAAVNGMGFDAVKISKQALAATEKE